PAALELQDGGVDAVLGEQAELLGDERRRVRDVGRRHRYADVDLAHLLAVLRGGRSGAEREHQRGGRERNDAPEAAQGVTHGLGHSVQLPMVTRPPAASTAAAASLRSTTCSTLGFFVASMSPTETS